MKTFKLSSYSFYAALILVIYIIVSNFLFFPQQIISYDIYGYYLYLPQTFIYHDLGIHNPDQVLDLMQKYGNSSTFYQASPLADGGYVMKYSMGLAILYAPFFFIAHFFAPLTGYAADGYSFPYQLALLVGGMLYTIAGILFLRKVLLRFVNEKITAISLILIVAATNFPIHTSMYGQNAMSHNFLFALYAVVLWLTIRWHETYKAKWIIFLGIICGITILSRPTEIVILAIPLLWGITSFKALHDKFNLLLKHFIQISLFGFIVLTFGFFQLIYWKIHTGHFLYYSYGSNPGEGLELFHPYFRQVLFSFRKGWLIYTPIMFFAIAGFAVLYKRNKKLFWPLIIYFIGNLYLISCWSTWWYANSFSQRPLVPALAVMSIPLGYMILWISERKFLLKIAFSIIIAFLIFLNIFQIWQFHSGIIDGERMTREYYSRIFLSTHATDEDRKYLLLDRYYYYVNGFDNEYEYNSRLYKTDGFENGATFDSIAPAQGSSYCILDSADTYSPVIESTYSELTQRDHAWLRVRVKLFPVSPPDSMKIAIVTHFSHNGFAYNYRAIESPTLVLQEGIWNDVKFDYLTPEVRQKSDLFRTFIWNISGGIVLVDDLRLEVFEKKEDLLK